MPDSTAPDFSSGFPVAQLQDGQMVLGKCAGEDVLLARRGDEIFAVGATCTHYSGPLAQGLLVGEQIRCPWHHACFSLRTGEALRAPAFDPIACYRVERLGDTVFVREKIESRPLQSRPIKEIDNPRPSSVVIIGGGAAGLAAADMLRRENYDGTITLLSADDAAPYDRPNLSKDYLAGSAPEQWMPLRSSDYYKENKIDLLLKARVNSIDPAQKRVYLEDGRSYQFGRLLLATGAEPIPLDTPGARGNLRLHYLRSMNDGKAIAAKAGSAKKAVLIGASFIALEAAAALRAREIEVDIVGLETIPLERVFGAEIGRFVQSLHESHGVRFHLGQTVSRFDGDTAFLSGGDSIEAELFLAGVGVRAAVGLAEKAGLKIDQGVAVNQFLETSSPGIFAAGDIARYPDPYSDRPVRIEHWVVAERQGQLAARNILGYRETYAIVPFFWTHQYDFDIKTSGHAEKWDAIEIEGNLTKRNCVVRYKQEGRIVSVATIDRDEDSLKFEAEQEELLKSIRPQGRQTDF